MLNRTMSTGGGSACLGLSWPKPGQGQAFGGKKIIVLACLILLLGGCGQKAQNQQPGQAQGNKDIFSSIKDAFNRSLTLRCEYTDESGQKSINYIKNKMIRTEMAQTSGEQTIGLFRDEKMYIWGPSSNQGMVFELSALKESSDAKIGNTTIHGTDDIINELEKYKNSCTTQNVPDSMFAVPTNVTFTNLNDLMKQFSQ